MALNANAAVFVPAFLRSDALSVDNSAVDGGNSRPISGFVASSQAKNASVPPKRYSDVRKQRRAEQERNNGHSSHTVGHSDGNSTGKQRKQPRQRVTRRNKEKHAEKIRETERERNPQQGKRERHAEQSERRERRVECVSEEREAEKERESEKKSLSPYLLALQRSTAAPLVSASSSASLTVSVAPAASTAPPTSVSAASLPRNKVVTFLPQSVQRKQAVVWAKRMADLQLQRESARTQRDSEEPSEGEREKERERETERDSSYGSLWHAVLRPRSQPVPQRVFLSLSAAQTNETRTDADCHAQKTHSPSHSPSTQTTQRTHTQQEALTEQDWWRAVFAGDLSLLRRCLSFASLAAVNLWTSRYNDEPLSHTSHDTPHDATHSTETSHNDNSENEKEIRMRSESVGLSAIHIFARQRTERYAHCLFSLLTLFPVLTQHIDHRDRTHKRTALHFAAESGDAGVITELLRLGSDASVRDKNGETALHIAVRHSHSSATEALIQLALQTSTHQSRSQTHTRRSLRVNERNRQGRTALHLCTHRSLCTQLLHAQADVSLTDCEGHTPLSLAAQRGDLSVLRVLLLSPHNTHSHNRNQHYTQQTINNAFNPFSQSSQSSHSIAAQRYPLHEAARGGHTSCVRMLLDITQHPHTAHTRTDELDALDAPLSLTPLMYSCIYGHTQCAHALLKHGARLGRCVGALCGTASLTAQREIVREQLQDLCTCEMNEGECTCVCVSVELQGLSELTLAALFQHDALLRHICAQVKLRIHSNSPCLAHTTPTITMHTLTSQWSSSLNPLTQLANTLSSLWQHAMPADRPQSLTHWREQRREAVLSRYAAACVSLIVCGVPVTRRFLDVCASAGCRRDLSALGIYADWPTHLTSFFHNEAFVDSNERELTSETPTDNSEISWMAKAFPSMSVNASHRVSLYAPTRHYDLVFVTDHGQHAVCSHTALWRAHSTVISELLSQACIRRVPRHDLTPTLQPHSLTHLTEEVYTLHFPHITHSILTMLSQYVETENDSVFFSLTEIRDDIDVHTLTQLTLTANELWMERAQRVCETQLMRVREWLCEEDMQILANTPSLSIFSRVCASQTEAQLSQALTQSEDHVFLCSCVRVERLNDWSDLVRLCDGLSQPRSECSVSEIDEDVTVRCVIPPAHEGCVPKMFFEIVRHHNLSLCACCREVILMTSADALLDQHKHSHTTGTRSSHTYLRPSLSLFSRKEDSPRFVCSANLEPHLLSVYPSRGETIEHHTPQHTHGLRSDISSPTVLLELTKRDIFGCSPTDPDVEVKVERACNALRHYLLLLIRQRLRLLSTEDSHDLLLQASPPPPGSSEESVSACVTMRVHKHIVLSASEKFLAMYHFEEQQRSSHSSSEVITLSTSISAAALPVLVHFLYTGMLPLFLLRRERGERQVGEEEDDKGGALFDYHLLLELSLVADEYFLPHLAEQCNFLMLHCLNPHTAGEIYELSSEKRLRTIERTSAMALLMSLCYSPMSIKELLAIDDSLEYDEEGEEGKDTKTSPDFEIDEVHRDFLERVFVSFVINQ